MKSMATKASKLCTYAIQQIGKPYWYGTAGQKASKSLYNSLKKSHPKYYKWAYSDSVAGQKVHDCSGLISAVVSVAHGATSQYRACSSRSSTKKNFPGIPGTLVFVNDGSDKSHVGVYIGKLTTTDGKKYTDAVVEAKGHRWGVVVSRWSDAKWGSWGQLKSSKLTYDTTKGQSFVAGSSNASSPTASVANTVNPQSIIKVNQIDPYIVTLGPAATVVDCQFLKKNGVAAAMIYAGALYDSSHKIKTYENPNLAKLASTCDKYNLPYALYVTVRAHTEIEADAECRALYYIISAYPPKFGLWLYIQTNKDQATNDKIIDVYYKYMQQWGLQDRCGIYIEISRLSSISWSKFQNKFYLWGIDKSIDFKKVEDKLLQPSMFEVK